MKKLLLLLFVLGLISCGGQKQEEAPAVQETAPESVMPADTAAVDTMATEVQEQVQE
ncbi:MAG: hypothetical protein H6627_02315 [Calditrichae bacterium]|nr:hypothetical protein [Calditrichota bacterium]MCB9057369.1 hypothetical protein [Calditrichia bacterium]